ncbi:MAG: hypothetical protein ACYCPF_22215 [Streptosporangiaceae bacterium]
MIRIRERREIRRRIAELERPAWDGGYRISPAAHELLRARARREWLLTAETDLALDLADNPLPSRRFT